MHGPVSTHHTVCKCSYLLRKRLCSHSLSSLNISLPMSLLYCTSSLPSPLGMRVYSHTHARIHSHSWLQTHSVISRAIKIRDTHARTHTQSRKWRAPWKGEDVTLWGSKYARYVVYYYTTTYCSVSDNIQPAHIFSSVIWCKAHSQGTLIGACRTYTRRDM